MKVLITSGGTRINLDSVRHIGNMSNGTLGAKLATQALKSGNEVIFFRAQNSKSPMSVKIDLSRKTEEDSKKAFNNVVYMWHTYGNRYHELEYKTFDDYKEKLPQIIALYKPDIIILAAAVSDYAPEKVMEGKIRTKGDLNIPLVPLPKVISNVRDWAGEKAFIVGFKLLVNVPKNELIEAAKDSLTKNKLNLVCANDLNTILAGNHMISLVTVKNTSQDCPADSLWALIEMEKGGKEF